MVKYYTRACNFYHGYQAKVLLKKKLAFPLCGNKLIAFDSVEFIIRKNNNISSELIKIQDIKKTQADKKKKIKEDLKKITSKRKNFLKNVDFSSTAIMGILNLTPDSFSDGGRFNSKKKSFQQLQKFVSLERSCMYLYQYFHRTGHTGEPRGEIVGARVHGELRALERKVVAMSF